MTAGELAGIRKTLNIEEKKKGKRYLLYFGGVYENAVLWVNGMKIGSHKYGYSSFKMDITDAVQSGDNELLMRVDNSVSPADRWYSGCGIYRDVTLRIVPENHLDLWNIQVHSKIEKIAETECAKDSKETESAAKIHCRHSCRDWTEQCCSGNYVSNYTRLKTISFHCRGSEWNAYLLY